MNESDLGLRNLTYRLFVEIGRAPSAHEVAHAWWSDRLDPEWRPRSTQDNQAILDRLGLTGTPWQLM